MKLYLASKYFVTIYCFFRIKKTGKIASQDHINFLIKVICHEYEEKTIVLLKF